MATVERQQRVPARSDPDPIWSFLEHIEGGVAFDIGANAGDVTAMLADHFEMVVSFEPCRESFDILRDREIGNVIPRNVALSRVTGKITLNEFSVATERFGELVTGTKMAYTWGEQTGVREVASSTIDREVGELGILPDFVKIDTEGHEVPIIEGGLTTITLNRPRLLIEVHAKEDGPKIEELLPDYTWAYSDGGPNYKLPHFREFADGHYYMLGVTK